MPVTQTWQVPSARVSLFEATRGQESIRETCPSTQIWLLLSGEWRELGDGQKLRLQKFATRRYAPKQPCRRIVEADSRALSIELFTVGGSPILSSQELRGVWRIAHLAQTNGFDSLELEEHLACFAEEHRVREGKAEWLERATEMIHANFREPLSLEGIASEVGISPNHLSAEFKAAHGIPMSKYVRRLRLEYALKRLDTEPTPWLSAGFYDASHFWHVCQADFGLKPNQIRALSP